MICEGKKKNHTTSKEDWGHPSCGEQTADVVAKSYILKGTIIHVKNILQDASKDSFTITVAEHYSVMCNIYLSMYRQG